MGRIPLGMNIPAFPYYSGVIPFVDLVMMSSPWTFQDYTTLANEIPVDANGYPVRSKGDGPFFLTRRVQRRMMGSVDNAGESYR